METRDLTRECQESNGVLIIPWEIDSALDYLAKKNEDEWQCFAEVEEIGQHSFRINNLRFPKQVNSGGNTKTEEEDFDSVLMDMDENKGFCWIHSHNSMGVFWSGTDYTQMDNQAKVNGRYAFSLVVNNKGGRKAALNMQNPIKANFDLLVDVELPQTDLGESCQALLDTVQTKKTYTYTKPATTQVSIPMVNSYDNYAGYEDYDGWDHEKRKWKKVEKGKKKSVKDILKGLTGDEPSDELVEEFESHCDPDGSEEDLESYIKIMLEYREE